MSESDDYDLPNTKPTNITSTERIYKINSSNNFYVNLFTSNFNNIIIIF